MPAASPKTTKSQRPVIMIIGRYDRNALGGQARFATMLMDEMDSDFRIVRLSIPYFASVGRLKRAWLAIGMFVRFVWLLLTKRVALVHVFTAANRTSIYEKLLFTTIARLLGRRTILNFRTAADFWFEHFTSIEQRVLAFLMRRNNCVLTQYQGLADYLVQKRYTTPGRVRVIPNGIELPAQESRAIQRSHSASNPVQFLSLGRIELLKGCDVLIESADLLRQRGHNEFRIRFVGPSYTPAEAEALKQQVIDAGLDDIIDFPGAMLGAEKEAMWNAADVFVMPTRVEGFPNVLLEAMLAGLSIIATDTGANSDVIHEGINGHIVPVEDPVRLADRMESLMQSEQRRIEMGNHNRIAVRERYALPDILDRFANLYRETLGLPTEPVAPPNTHQRAA